MGPHDGSDSRYVLLLAAADGEHHADGHEGECEEASLTRADEAFC